MRLPSFSRKSSRDGKKNPRSLPSSRTILLVMLLLAIAVFIPPRLTESWRASMVEETASLESQAESLNARTSKVDQALSDQEAIAKALGEVSAAVPSTPELPKLIAAIDEVVTGGGMDWVSGAPSATSFSALTEVDASGNIVEGSGAGKAWSFPVTIVGPLDRLPDVLDGLRSMPRMLTVDSVGFQTFEDGEVTVAVDLRFYAMGEEESAS